METNECGNESCRGNIDGECTTLDGKTGCAAWYPLVKNQSSGNDDISNCMESNIRRGF